MNDVKKSFVFEDDLYNEVTKFIEDDRTVNGDKNFNDNYVNVMNFLRKEMNSHFAGQEYMMSLMERAPGRKTWQRSIDADTNFGNIWECVANKFLSTIESSGYTGWPNGKFEFPDFNIFGTPGDYKAILSDCYNDTSANRTRNLPIGYLKPDGHASLYKLDEYKADIDLYKSTGVLSDHLRALLVFAIYNYYYDNKTGVKYAHIYDIICCPAMFCINFNMDGTLSLRNDGLTIGFQERNFKFISQKNFGI